MIALLLSKAPVALLIMSGSRVLRLVTLSTAVWSNLGAQAMLVAEANTKRLSATDRSCGLSDERNVFIKRLKMKKQR